MNKVVLSVQNLRSAIRLMFYFTLPHYCIIFIYPSIEINTRRTCAQRGLLYVCTCVCVCVCLSVRSFLPPRVSRPRNIGTYVFTATCEKFYIRDFR